MACDCATEECNCLVTGTGCASVTGSGTVADPYIVDVDVPACETVFAATSVDGSVGITAGGVNGHSPDLGVNLDPDPNNIIVSTGSGLLVDGSALVFDDCCVMQRIWFGT